MAQQIINIGTADNDGTGDPARTAFNKTNQNFTELYNGAAAIADDTVTYAKMQNVSAASLLLGRGSAAGAGDPQEITLGTNLAMSGTVLNATGGGGSATPVSPQGRLTLQTATPVMTTTQSAKTAIFYTPYVGSQIVLFNGTSMVPTTFSELTVATTNTANSPAAIGASKVNDWFVWDSGGGTLRLVHGPDWTDDVTRSAGTALVMVNGILLNNAAITNGPAAQRGTYVGTTRSNASSQLDWIYGGLATNGTAAVLGVWNCYNRVLISTLVADDTNTWTYAVANTWRAPNGSATMRASFVRGLDENCIISIYSQCVTNGAGTVTYMGVGLDSTTAFSGVTGFTGNTSGIQLIARYNGLPGIGYHFISGLEGQNTATASTWRGDNGTPLLVQTGLQVELQM